MRRLSNNTYTPEQIEALLAQVNSIQDLSIERILKGLNNSQYNVE